MKEIKIDKNSFSINAMRIMTRPRTGFAEEDPHYCPECFCFRYSWEKLSGYSESVKHKCYNCGNIFFTF